MKRLALLTGAAALAFPAAAFAGVFELDAQVHGGGMGGKGMSGDLQDQAFHAGVGPFAYGLKLGAEVLFIDGWIEHNQFRDGDGLNGTWTQFMFGLDMKIDMGDKVGPIPAQGTEDKRHTKGFAELGMAVGFGVGTGQQVDPPLDNSEITDKGGVAQVHLDFGYRMSRTVSIGLHLPVQGGYLFKNEGPANEGGWYATLQGAALATFRLSFSLTN